jgi:putative membrane protein
MRATSICLLVGGLAAAAAAPALAHSVDSPSATALGIPWSFEPWVIFCLAASAILYALGLARLWGRAGRAHGVNVIQASAFAAGWLTLFVALVTPLDPLGSVLFSAHMVQHELLMLVAAPLLVLGRPLALWAWALPQPWRKSVGRFFHHPLWRGPWLVVTSPLVAWLLHALALWLWHIPALFDAALNDDAVHGWQHASFLFTALLFWWSVLGAVTRKEQGLALVSLFTTMVHTGALGALLALARTPWYAHYFSTTSAFGINALEDQQLGGLIMWVPAGGIYILCGLVIAGRWIQPRVRRAARLIAQ